MVRQCIWTMIFPGSKTCTNDRPGWSGEAKTLEGLLSKVLVEVCSFVFFFGGGVTSNKYLVCWDWARVM